MFVTTLRGTLFHLACTRYGNYTLSLFNTDRQEWENVTEYAWEGIQSWASWEYGHVPFKLISGCYSPQLAYTGPTHTPESVIASLTGWLSWVELREQSYFAERS